MRLSKIVRRHSSTALMMMTSLLVMSGCATHMPSPRAPLSDLPARYAGTLPCGDCAGIDYQLTLTADHQYLLHAHYQGTLSSDDFVEIGQWRFDQDKQVMTLSPDNSDDASGTPWRVEPDRLTVLTATGDAVESRLNFSLKRVDMPTEVPLVGTRWTMANSLDESGRNAAYFVLNTQHDEVTGSTGCNYLTGRYHQQDERLTLKPLSITRMACGEIADTEQAFLQTLNQTQSFRVIGSYLLVYGGPDDPAPLAIFRHISPST